MVGPSLLFGPFTLFGRWQVCGFLGVGVHFAEVVVSSQAAELLRGRLKVGEVDPGCPPHKGCGVVAGQAGPNFCEDA